MDERSRTRTSRLSDEEECEHTFTEEEVQELANFIESLTLIDIAALKKYWESKDIREHQLQ